MSEKSDLQELSANASLPSLPNVFLSFQPQPSSLHKTYEEIADISPYCPPNLKPPHYQQGGDQYWRGSNSQMRGGNNYYYGGGNNNYYGGNYYNNYYGGNYYNNNYGNRGFHGSGQKQRGGWNDYNNRNSPMKRPRNDHDISAYYKKSFLQDPWQKDKK